MIINSSFDFIFGSLRYFITKCDRYYYKIRQLIYYKLLQNLLQIASGFVLRNVTVLLQFMTLLQNALILLQSTTVITNCDVYYKMCRYSYLQNSLLDLQAQVDIVVIKIEKYAKAISIR